MIRGRDRIGIPHQRIAVRLLSGDIAITDRAAGAGAVEHDYIHTELSANPVREQARGHIGRRARGEKYGNFDGAFLRKSRILRRGTSRQAEESQGTEDENFISYLHDFLPINRFSESLRSRPGVPPALTGYRRGRPQANSLLVPRPSPGRPFRELRRRILPTPRRTCRSSRRVLASNVCFRA